VQSIKMPWRLADVVLEHWTLVALAAGLGWAEFSWRDHQVRCRLLSIVSIWIFSPNSFWREKALLKFLPGIANAGLQAARRGSDLAFSLLAPRL
jgi:hypothetical protein